MLRMCVPDQRNDKDMPGRDRSRYLTIQAFNEYRSRPTGTDLCLDTTPPVPPWVLI